MDWTKEQTELALTMRRAGETVEKIAEVLKKSTGSVQAKFKRMKKAGVNVPDSPNDPTKKVDVENQVEAEIKKEFIEIATETNPEKSEGVLIPSPELRQETTLELNSPVEQMIFDTSKWLAFEIRVSKSRKQIAIFINKEIPYLDSTDEWMVMPLVWKKGACGPRGQAAGFNGPEPTYEGRPNNKEDNEKAPG